MKFLTHPSFMYAAGMLLRAFDGDNEIVLFTDEYPDGTADLEWLPCVGKQRPRPVIISADNGVLGNRVGRQTLRECGCTFVYFSRGWSKMVWPEYAYKLIKCWPKVLQEANDSSKQSVLEVAVNGTLHRINL